MRRLALLVLILAAVVSGSPMTSVAAGARDATAVRPAMLEAVAGAFLVLCYHEARDDVRDYPDPFAVDTEALVRQFAWLRANGYTPVSLDQILAARQGGEALPAKAVLLTFDDAYLSFYTRVYPLLREFGFPAVVGVVGKWIDDPSSGAAPYGEKGTVPYASFPSWSQLREMADSGLVEIASHTYDLHRGVPSNPQGNLQAAATSRIYDAATGSYEGDASWRARVRADLALSASVIERETGRRPRVIVWPYGSYNDELVRMAGELGMPIALTLDDGANTPDVPLTAVRRVLVAHNPALPDFTLEARGPIYPWPVRVVQVNLESVFSTDPAQQERNLSVLLDRMHILKPSHVYLQATADADGDGTADAAWFPNRHLPLRNDLFGRVAWQLASRLELKVFAVMPVTNLRLRNIEVAELYEDLARHASFSGLVFDDVLQRGGPEDAETLKFTRQLAMRARAFRAPLQTVRVTYSVHSLPALAAEYDYVALRGHASPPPDDTSVRRKIVYLLPNSSLPGQAQRLARQMRALQLAGALNFGYGPDDFLNNNPALEQIAPAMSLRAFPLPPAGRER